MEGLRTCDSPEMTSPWGDEIGRWDYVRRSLRRREDTLDHAYGQNNRILTIRATWTVSRVDGTTAGVN